MSKVMTRVWTVRQGLLAGLFAVVLTAGCHHGNGTASNPDGGDASMADAPDAHPAADRVDVPPDLALDTFTCPPAASKALGDSCTCGTDCATGFCADGVCCGSACNEGCRTCAAPGSLGTCTNLPTGSSPGPSRGKTTCTAQPSSSCGLDGKCDGAGACRNYPATTPCKGGSCQGDAVVGGFACNGAGQCKPSAMTTICSPYTCDPTTGACFDTCVTPAMCSSGQVCAAGSCGKRGPGYPCPRGASDCLSNFCADGVCCNVACQGACVSCAQPGRQGTCWPIDAKVPDPRGKCIDEGSGSCGHDGTCDGVGGCARYKQDTQCQAPSCSGNKLNTAGTCDGLGTCRPPLVASCHPFRCVNGGCTNTCQTDLDCDTGIACVNNTCGPKQNGQMCADASECASNHCVDAVCCESACTGACRSCALPGSPGRCIAVAPGNPDVRSMCKDNKAAACGTNGLCDGSGNCQKYAVGTQCADETCSGNVHIPPSTCSASGQCVAPEAQPCRPYVCNGNKCFSVCTTDAQCLGPNVCQANSCGPKPDGATCSAATECASSFCEQGVCCHTACQGACQSCALATTLGTCSNIATGSIDSAGICTDQGQTTCGTNGKCEAGACQKYLLGTSCHDPTCPAGTTASTGASTCDGAGTCVQPATISCFPYQCGTNVCRNACASNADCATPAVCINSACGLKPPGVPCSDATECQTGFCAQGYCCQSACNTTCKSCGLTGSLGACTNVPNGKGDPKQSCSDMGAMSCSTDGFCDGNGGCRLYDATTSCAAPTCPAGASTATSVRLCDGKGACQAPTSLACAPYVCNGTTACKGACTSDNDCLSPNICDPQTNLCGNKKRLGQSCTATADCLTGANCVDGVCCSATACSPCQACNVAGSAGNCTNVPLGIAEPHGLCGANPPCGNTGACNGAGACQQAGTGVSCGTASCTGTTFTPVSHCTGNGGCAAPTASSCGAYVCGAAACKTTCTADGDCVAPFTCQAGNCALKPNGITCANAAQCISGFCTDGVCCGSASCPTCQACNVNGVGSCAAIAAGTTAPGTQCPANPPCGNTGKCNGASGCQQSGTGTTCGTASCSGMTFTPLSHCDGAGTCATPTTSTCVPYVCGAAACKTICQADADCVSGFYCTGANGSCLPKKGSGSCTAAHECATGFCVDGFCCGVASCPTCQACGSTGMCGNVTSGATDPHARCTAGATCGNTGACDGSGACTQAPTSQTCGTASCSGATYTPVSHCDGAGACATPTTQVCAPYVCGSTACRTDCTTDADCSSGYYCTGAGGSCLPKKGSGSCAAAHECATGFCVDGFCCGVASCPTCQVCGGTGMCGNVGSGTADPHARCTAGATCGNTGACDGAGACQQAATTVQCGSASCAGSTFTPAAFCSGSGTCANPGTMSCGAYVCGVNACRTTCSADTDCTTGNYCTGTNGSCVADKGPGTSCGGDHECGTGHCTDGVCCNAASCATCKACDVTGSAGVCANVVANGAEPHARCPSGGTCGNTGACDGGGACQQAATSVSCGSASCAGSTFTPAAFCSGSGSCSTPATQSCAPYVCGTNACKLICNADSDCTTGNYCTGSGGSCTAKKGLGTGCGADHECGSGQCTDGVCCTVNACGTCQACNGTGSCATVANGTPEPHGACAANGTCGNTGLCRSGACEQAAASVQCNGPSCSGSTLTNAAFCSGSGSCSASSTQSCAPYVCGTNACKVSCSSDGDCTGGNYCTGTGGTCVGVKNPGALCGADHECGTGNCVDGVCCNLSSCGTCQVCNLSGNGSCTNVANGTAEPHGGCAANGTCGNTGKCSGGACQQAASSVVCGNATCSGTSFQPTAFCSGSGGCSVPPPQECAPLLCTSGGCPGTCSVDGNCVSGDYCTGPGGSCQPTRANGKTCTGDNQCTNGHCTEGFCCGVGACPSCQSCAVAGSEGMCTNVPNGGADPTGTCVDQGAAGCQHDGKCSGGACRLYPSSTVCAASCTDLTTLTQTFCDGAGTCGPGTAPMSCSPLACVVNACL